MRYSEEHIQKTEELKSDIAKLKIELRQLIHPSREYLNYFLEYFPDWDTVSGKNKIRSCWNGQSASEDVIKMMKIIIEKHDKSNTGHQQGNGSAR